MDASLFKDAGVSVEPLSEVYELGNFLGKGTSGDAYVGTRKTDRQQVVLKRICITDLTDEAKRDALSEVKMLAQFKHPNIIKYHESIIEVCRRMLSAPCHGVHFVRPCHANGVQFVRRGMVIGCRHCSLYIC